jgi:hypothetical protein
MTAPERRVAAALSVAYLLSCSMVVGCSVVAIRRFEPLAHVDRPAGAVVAVAAAEVNGKEDKLPSE